MCDPKIMTKHCRGAMNDRFKHLLKRYMEDHNNKEELLSFLSFYGLNDPSKAELAYDLYISYNLSTSAADAKQLTKKAFVTMFKILVKLKS
jgi:hypothetical protein